MLIRLTNQCGMGCSHCLIDAKPKGDHIELDTFRDALEFAEYHNDPMVLLSGGEPTEHPQVVELTHMAKARLPVVAVISNGMFLADKALSTALLDTGASFQITHDPRFYPRKPPRVDHPLLTYVDRVTQLDRLGRYKGESERIGPACFNLRSATREFRCFTAAVYFLRSQAQKHCTPSIDPDGTIRAGESSLCHPIGTIWNTDAEITERILDHDCDRCGLHARLPDNFLKAVNRQKGP